MGRYDSGYTATIPAIQTLTTKSSNIGCSALIKNLILKCTSTDQGYAVNDEVVSFTTTIASAAIAVNIGTTNNSVFFITGNSSIYAQSKTTGGYVPLTNANWSYKLIAQRGW